MFSLETTQFQTQFSNLGCQFVTITILVCGTGKTSPLLFQFDLLYVSAMSSSSWLILRILTSSESFGLFWSLELSGAKRLLRVFPLR